MHDHKAPEGQLDDSHKAGTFRVSVSNENFQFHDVDLPDQKVTGAEIIHAAGHRPVEDYVVLLQLKSGELESLRPTELVDIGARGVERFFVIKGATLYRFFVDGLAMEWPMPQITGGHIKALIGAGDDVELLLERTDEPEMVVEDDDHVRLSADGVEKLKTRKHQLTIFVDGEEYHPPRREMTPNEIIRKAAEKDPATTYLVQITREGRISYEGKGDIPIKLHNGMQFQVICVGPTPVSEPAIKTGVGVFIDGLRQLGFAPVALSGKPDHVVFDYVVPTGKFKGRQIKLGLIVPQDFPMNPPGGPHMSPGVHPINTSGEHPTGSVHKNHAQPFQKALGGDWQYWSRPFKAWPNTKRTAAAYMSYIWQLWDTQ